MERPQPSEEASKAQNRRQMLENWKRSRMQKQDKENATVSMGTPTTKKTPSTPSKTTDDVALTNHERQAQQRYALHSISLNSSFPTQLPSHATTKQTGSAGVTGKRKTAAATPPTAPTTATTATATTIGTPVPGVITKSGEVRESAKRSKPSPPRTPSVSSAQTTTTATATAATLVTPSTPNNADTKLVDTPHPVEDTPQFLSLLKERQQLQHKLDHQAAEIESLKITLEYYQNRDYGASSPALSSSSSSSPSASLPNISNTPLSHAPVARTTTAVSDSESETEAQRESEKVEEKDTNAQNDEEKQKAQTEHHQQQQKSPSHMKRNVRKFKEKFAVMRTQIAKNDVMIEKLKELLVKSLDHSKQLENDLRRKTQKTEQLEAQLTELNLLYNVAQKSLQNANYNDNSSDSNNSNDNNSNNQYLFDAIQERTEVIMEMRQEMKRLREENAALRFSNELLMQQMGEMRGRFVTRLQELHQEHKAVEAEYKADMHAWNELMNITVKRLQEEMARGLRDSVAKISSLEQQLQQQQQVNVQLQDELQHAQQQQQQLLQHQQQQRYSNQYNNNNNYNNKDILRDSESEQSESESEKMSRTREPVHHRMSFVAHRQRNSDYYQGEECESDGEGEAADRDTSMQMDD